MNKRWLVLALGLLGACGGTSGEVVGRLGELRSSNAAVSAESETRSTTSLASEDVDESSTMVIKDDLKKVFALLMQARIECGRKPYSCDVATFTELNSPIYHDLTELIATRRRAHITATGGGEVRYRIDKTKMVSDSKALIYVCMTDDVVLLDGDIIFDDSMMSSLVTFTLTNIEGRWLWSEGTPTQWTTEEDLCGFDA